MDNEMTTTMSEVVMVSGYIYILFSADPLLADRCKIGSGTQHPQEKAQTLYTSAVAFPFEVFEYWEIPNVSERDFESIDDGIQYALQNFRAPHNKGCFVLSPELARSKINEYLSLRELRQYRNTELSQIETNLAKLEVSLWNLIDGIETDKSIIHDCFKAKTPIDYQALLKHQLLHHQQDWQVSTVPFIRLIFEPNTYPHPMYTLGPTLYIEYSAWFEGSGVLGFLKETINSSVSFRYRLQTGELFLNNDMKQSTESYMRNNHLMDADFVQLLFRIGLEDRAMQFKSLYEKTAELKLQLIRA